MAAAVLPQGRLERVPRVKGYHASRNHDRAAVVAELRKSDWTGRALIPDINRIARGTCQASFLWSVYYHTQGKPHDTRRKDWTPPEFTERMLPDDFAMEGGFTPQQMREEIDDACQPNPKTGRPALVARMAETGPDRYRFRLLRENWKTAPNAFIPRKGPGTEEDSSKAEGEEKADTQEAATARVVMLPGKLVKVVPGRRYEIEKSGCKAIEYHCSAPLSARVTAGVLHLTEHKGEEKASTREAATSRVVELSRRNGASPPARPTAAELRSVIRGLGVDCDERMAPRLARMVPEGCHSQFITDLLAARLQQAPRFKPAYLPKFFTENLREAWAEERKSQNARESAAAAADLEQRARGERAEIEVQLDAEYEALATRTTGMPSELPAEISAKLETLLRAEIAREQRLRALPKAHARMQAWPVLRRRLAAEAGLPCWDEWIAMEAPKRLDLNQRAQACGFRSYAAIQEKYTAALADSDRGADAQWLRDRFPELGS